MECSHRLTNKLAVITGGARGIGAAIARRFVEEGAVVIVTDVLDEQGQALCDELGEQARYHHLDVSDASQWQTLMNFARRLGKVEILINNAAILHINSIDDTSETDFMRVVQVNQLGTFLGMKAVLADMKQAGGGNIINISSIDGLQAKNGIAAYSATKWAMRGLTKTAAIEFGKFNIRVNSIHPGGIYTAMHGATKEGELPDENMTGFYKYHPLPRVGMPIEVANMAVFVASDECSYSTGAEFVLDGGWHAGMRINALPGC
ncbi:glucose 1-dehydrogenase [Spongiibacter taiwanensis]|uniref:glucose 1-dehydrogenase n=1 Tax=Spongiibacter taiwanensis TaxID=1748242 RepID=UPI002034C12D|nr:glucose 1-dehydrogenase [Spongiibacter taiwanensis]USA43265.1 glucose 1-dehydrogenase [Spongiibacter taiwanensis]